MFPDEMDLVRGFELLNVALHIPMQRRIFVPTGVPYGFIDRDLAKEKAGCRSCGAKEVM